MSAPQRPRRIKCRYCDYTTLAWFKTKNGNRHSGMARMVEHVRDEHMPTYVLAETIDEMETLGDYDV